MRWWRRTGTGAPGAGSGPGATLTTPVSCPACQGWLLDVSACLCTYNGPAVMVTQASTGPGPYAGCLLCAGVGTRVLPCATCGGGGRCRPQVVISVWNLDTGAVASANVVPGVLEPIHTRRGWVLDVLAVVDDLATRIGVERVYTPGPMAEPVPRGGRHLAHTGDVGLADLQQIPVPQWQPDASWHQQLLAQAHAIALAAGSGSGSWRVFPGRSTPLPPPDPDADLRRLCDLADLLCLDLAVYRWSDGTSLIRLQLPGAPLADAGIWPADTLAENLHTIDVARDLQRAVGGGEPAPAYHLTATGPPARENGGHRTIADLLAALGERCTRGDAAIAIWRNHTWHLRDLVAETTGDRLFTHATGQIGVHHRRRYVLAEQLPDPAYWQHPIDAGSCPDCLTHPLAPCACTRPNAQATPDCPLCQGNGVYPPSTCHTCGGTAALYDGVTITVTDLDHVQHLNWAPSDDARWSTVGTHGDGTPILRTSLPDTLAGLIADGVDAAGLLPVSAQIRDGLLYRPDLPATDTDLLRQYLRDISTGRTGGRLLIITGRTPPIGTEALLRGVLGLGLGADISVDTHRGHRGDPLQIHGERWAVRVNHDPDDLTPDHPCHHSLPAAVAALCSWLPTAISPPRKTVQADTAISVPQQPHPATDDITGLAAHLRRVSEHYDTTVTARLRRGTCHLYLVSASGDLELLAAAASVAQAVTALLGPAPDDY